MDQPPKRSGERGNATPGTAGPAAPNGFDDEFEPPVGWPPGRRRMAALAAGGLVIALVSYTVGWSRGSAGLDEGSSTTTSIVGSDPVSGGAATETTLASPVPAPTRPTVTAVTVDFDDGVPRDVDGRAVDERGGWRSIGGAIGPSDPQPLPGDAAHPRLMGTGPDLTIDTGGSVSLAQVKLVQPTSLSGLVARYQDDQNYWAAVLNPSLTRLTLYEVHDGVQTGRAFVDVAATPGITIGILAVGGEVGLVVNGAPMALRTFFGPKATVSDRGIDGHRVGLLTGLGAPTFDDLSFG